MADLQCTQQTSIRQPEVHVHGILV